MKKAVFQIYVIALLSFINVSGQELPNVVPPSPEAASVFKFAEVPVSLHTGVPNITIPLFEIESGGVTIPISISYHARGVQVAEIASRVGTGWALNAGGMVSRQMRRSYDDDPVTGYLNNNIYDGFFTSNEKRDSVVSTYSGYHDLDFIPDQYYFNTPNGLNGKFIYDNIDGEVLPQNYSNIDIKKTTSLLIGITGFEITDGKGNKYFFGNNEMIDYDIEIQNYTMYGGSYTQTDPGAQSLKANTWHLTKIKAQTGQEITFTYQNESTMFLRRSYDKYDHSESQYVSYSSKTLSEQKRIKEIIFDKGKVVFEYHTEGREDLYYGGNYLKQIKLLDKNDNIIKQKVFDYEYTNSSDIDNNNNSNYYLRSLEPEASKRLFLKSVQTTAPNNDTLPAYRFEYDPNKLPGRHSNSQDVWGYYNGKDNGQFLMSSYSGIGTRAVDTVKSGAGMLKKIIYPEGGSANFYYEHNRVFNTYPKNLVYFDSPNPLIQKTKIVSALEYSQTFIDSITNLPVYSQSENIYRSTFVITDAVAGGNMRYKTMGSVCGDGAPQPCKFSATIRNQYNEVVRTLHPTLPNEFRNINVLPPGTYTLVVKPLGPHNPIPIIDNPEEFFMVSVNWIEEIAGPNEPIYAAGKRIKKIEYRDSQDNIGLTKTYSYTNPVTGKSSGMLFGLPNFMGIMATLTNVMGGTYTIFSPYGNIPGSPLSTYQGSSLGYGVVTEYFGEGSNIIGKSVHRFTNTPESGDFYTFPFHPPADHEWLRGKELSVTHYGKNSNGTYSPVKKIENEYLYGGNTETSTPAVFYSLPYRKPVDESLNCNEPIELYCTHSVYIKNKKMFRIPLAAFYWHHDELGVPSTNLMYKVYHMTGGTFDLWKTKVTDYFDGGNEVVSETEYGYDYNKHYNPSVAIQSTSNNDVSIYSKYSYSTSLGTVNQDMADKNMLDIPLKVRKSIGLPVRLSEEETVYKKWNFGSHNFLAPEFVKTSKGLNNLETRIRYLEYDDKGNPLEVRQENGTHIVYIWGYHKTKPIAKIENATYTQVEQYVANLQALSNGVNESGLITALNNLRANLPNTMVTTYTYKPLVGVSSITDPRGNKITYHYDPFGRLEYVKDTDGNILSENEYHYRTQN